MKLEKTIESDGMRYTISVDDPSVKALNRHAVQEMVNTLSLFDCPVRLHSEEAQRVRGDKVASILSLGCRVLKALAEFIERKNTEERLR